MTVVVPDKVHLVGSVALDTVEEVIRAAGIVGPPTEAGGSPVLTRSRWKRARWHANSLENRKQRRSALDAAHKGTIKVSEASECRHPRLATELAAIPCGVTTAEATSGSYGGALQLLRRPGASNLSTVGQ
jgi:hypothetical protein